VISVGPEQDLSYDWPDYMGGRTFEEMRGRSDWGCQNIPTLDVDRRKHCETYWWVSLFEER